MIIVRREGPVIGSATLCVPPMVGRRVSIVAAPSTGAPGAVGVPGSVGAGAVERGGDDCAIDAEGFVGLSAGVALDTGAGAPPSIGAIVAMRTPH
jgi:hypothetical protein